MSNTIPHSTRTTSKGLYLRDTFGIDPYGFPVLYLRFSDGKYYVGHTNNLESHYSWKTIYELVWVKQLHTWNKNELRAIERETIQFCLLFGLSLSNSICLGYFFP